MACLDEHVVVENSTTGELLWGDRAPRRRELGTWLFEHPGWEIKSDSFDEILAASLAASHARELGAQVMPSPNAPPPATVTVSVDAMRLAILQKMREVEACVIAVQARGVEMALEAAEEKAMAACRAAWRETLNESGLLRWDASTSTGTRVASVQQPATVDIGLSQRSQMASLFCSAADELCNELSSSSLQKACVQPSPSASAKITPGTTAMTTRSTASTQASTSSLATSSPQPTSYKTSSPSSSSAARRPALDDYIHRFATTSSLYIDELNREDAIRGAGADRMAAASAAIPIEVTSTVTKPTVTSTVTKPTISAASVFPNHVIVSEVDSSLKARAPLSSPTMMEKRRSDEAASAIKREAMVAYLNVVDTRDSHRFPSSPLTSPPSDEFLRPIRITSSRAYEQHSAAAAASSSPRSTEGDQGGNQSPNIAPTRSSDKNHVHFSAPLDDGMTPSDTVNLFPADRSAAEWSTVSP